MHDAIANLAYSVLTYGLQLKARVERGEPATFDLEQAALKGILLSHAEPEPWSDAGGRGRVGAGGSRADQAFLGARYPLVCWLDELFIADSPWSERWNEQKLEVALFGTNERAWKFWEQARLAETRAGADAVEVFYLCVMLGFRGEYREQPERLQGWVAAARAQLARTQTQQWPYPPELEPPSHVPPLHGRKRFRRMLTLGGAALLVIVPLLVFLAVSRSRG